MIRITLRDLKQLSARAKAVVADAREQMLAPDSIKRAPVFSLSDVELATGKTLKQIRTALRSGEDDLGALPQGRTKDEVADKASELDGRGQKKYFTAEEFHRICRFMSPERFRSATAPGVVMTVCNFKGGVTKSTSAACIAQALSSLGYGRLLIVDLDPQGSLSNLFGFLQVLDVEPSQTALPVLSGEADSLKPSLRETYWPGIHIVPSCPALQIAEANFRGDIEQFGTAVMMRMASALKELRSEYDFIIFDTPPSLNNLTLHALMNSDGVIMPLPPSNLDLASASMFWDMFTDSFKALGVVDEDTEVFSFMRVFSPKMEKTRSCRNVLSWIKSTYGGYFSDVAIPKSAAVSNASDAFGTVFDGQVDSSLKRSPSHMAVKTAYMELSQELVTEAMELWKQAADTKQ